MWGPTCVNFPRLGPCGGGAGAGAGFHRHCTEGAGMVVLAGEEIALFGIFECLSRMPIPK